MTLQPELHSHMTNELASTENTLSVLSGLERRREVRLPTMFRAAMRILLPVVSDRWGIKIVNTSRNGAQIRTPEQIHPGSIVQIYTTVTVQLGEVVYCSERGGEFVAGVHIEDSMTIRRRKPKANRLRPVA